MDLLQNRKREATEDIVKPAPDIKKNERNAWDFALKTLVAIGLIILLVIAILIPIKYVPGTISKLVKDVTSTFRSATTTPAVVPSKTEVDAGEAFSIAWKKPTTDGSYFLSYECQPGLNLTETSDPQNPITVACENPYMFTPASTSTQEVVVIANSDQRATTTLTIHLNFLGQGSTTQTKLGDTSVIVKNMALSSTTQYTENQNTASTTNPSETQTAPLEPAEEIPRTTTQTSRTTSIYVAPAPTPDLFIQLVSAGIIDPITNQFVQTGQIGSNSRMAIKVAISNIGNVTAGPFKISATLPSTNPSEAYYVSPVQPSLVAGGRIELTISFSGIRTGQSQIVIKADSENTVIERNEYNNTMILNAYSAGENVSGNSYNNGQSDLQVRALGTGVLRNGVFVQTSQTYTNDRGAIRFEVVNIGGQQSGTYGYEIRIPNGNNYNNNDQTVRDYNQRSIAPGGKVIYTAVFDTNRSQDGQQAQILITPQSYDANSGNNTVYVTLRVY